MATTTKQPTSSKPQPPAVSTVSAAEQTVTQLQEKREKLFAERSRIEGEMGKHSFAAHARSDMRAVEALDQIATDISRLDARVREIDLAIATANRALLDARQAERQAANRQRAEEARELVRELGKVFPYLDRKLEEAANALTAINDGVAQLHAAGFQFPSDSQLRLGVAAILQTWAHRLPRSWHDQLRDGFEFLAPGRRQTAAEYWAQIQASIDGQITQRAGGTERTDTEAA
jgi:hypothetical protein